MAIPKLKIRCRIDELPTLCNFLITSMNGSLTDFTGYSPDFNAAYVTSANADLVVVENLVKPKQLTEELKVITLRIYGNRIALRSKIDFLEGYINRATGLTIGKKGFGISQVRDRNNKGDIEGLVGALGFLITNVVNNQPALALKGYTPVQHAALIAIKDAFKTDNTAQNTKENDRNNKVIANYAKLNALWDKMADISDAGKRIYKATAPNRLDDFTMSKLKARINQERNNTKIEGTVTSAGIPVNGAKIELQPLGVGRKRSAKTKADGKYVIKSIEPADYMAVASATGFTQQDAPVAIVTGVTVSKDWVMM